MSVCANITVLFKNAPDAGHLQAVGQILSNRTGMPVSDDAQPYGRMVEVFDADLISDVNEDGSLRCTGDDGQRLSPLLGAPRLQGRLYRIDYLSRFWESHYRQGPMVQYAITMLCLLSQPNIEGVWYDSENFWSDGGTSKAMTPSRVHALIDDFVKAGEYSHDQPTRYIRTEDGRVINI